MNLNDFRNAIEDYIINSGKNINDWDIDGAAREMRDMFTEAESIDDVDPDEFTEILQRNEM